MRIRTAITHKVWLFHAALVTLFVLTLLVLALTQQNDPSSADENIGAGLVAIVLGLGGLPWSLAATLPDSDTWQVCIIIGANLVNLGLHALAIDHSHVSEGPRKSSTVEKPDPTTP